MTAVRSGYHRPGLVGDERVLPPTPRQLDVIGAYVRTGSEKAAAAALGISIQTVKNDLSSLYRRLGVTKAMEALTALGWVEVPGDPPKRCGWTGYCSRLFGHRGQHGGFRAILPERMVRS